MFKAIISLFLWPIWFLYLLIILPVFLIFILIVNKKYFHYFLRPMSYFFCLLGGQLIKKTGIIPDPKDGPYLYLFNHQSLFDHFVIGTYINHYVTAVAKHEHLSYPLWGQVAKFYGIVPINRTNIKKALSSLKVVEDSIVNDKASVLIAPEGTRTRNGDLGVFKKGAFHIAKNTGVKIIPVIIDGAYKAKNTGDWRLTPGIINIHFSEVIQHEEYSSMTIEELRDYTRNHFKKFVD